MMALLGQVQVTKEKFFYEKQHGASLTTHAIANTGTRCASIAILYIIQMLKEMFLIMQIYRYMHDNQLLSRRK